MPRSPWLASLGCTKKAGVPVEAKVAAILRPTWPDLPMPVTISRPRAAEIRSTAAMKARPSPSWMAADERGDAAGLGLERAQRRGDQVAAARVGRSLGAQRFRHCRWSGLSGSQPWNSTETGGKRPPARPRRLYHIRFHRVNHSPVSGAAVVGVAVVGVAAAAAGVAQAATAVCSLPPCGQGYRIWKSCAHTSPCGMDRIGEATQSFRIGFGFVLGSIRWPCVDSAKACPRSGRIQQGQSHMR